MRARVRARTSIRDGFPGITEQMSDAQIDTICDALRKVADDRTIETEIAKASAWMAVNPKRTKTPRGLGRFLVGWVTRAVPQTATTGESDAREVLW